MKKGFIRNQRESTGRENQTGARRKVEENQGKDNRDKGGKYLKAKLGVWRGLKVKNRKRKALAESVGELEAEAKI